MGTLLTIPTKSRKIVAAREQERCLRCGTPTQAPQWHHRRSRSVRDPHTHCPCNGVHLCLTCHTWVHANPFEARKSGFIVTRAVAEPASVPVQAWFATLFLLCDGDFDFKVEREA